MARTISEVMTPDPVTISEDATVAEAARQMRDYDIGDVLITDNRGLRGVVTDRDIVCRIVAKGKDPSSCSAQDAMTQPVVAVLADTTLAEVVAVMEENQIRRVPVVDASGCCCGIIAQADVALVAKESEVGEMVREVSRDSSLH